VPNGALPGSFRDPSGYLFHHGGELFRHVGPSCAEAWEALVQTQFFDLPEVAERTVRFYVVDDPRGESGALAVLRPERIPFVSYPYEWTFGQRKAAALLTLDLQLIALDHSFELRDATAFNVQFVGPKPVHIDTLSFGKYVNGRPWIAYGQFCRHFLAPLALESYVDARMGRWLQVHLDGIPLDLAAKLLPWRLRLRPGLAMHLFAQARSAREGLEGGAARIPRIPKANLTAVIQNLRATVAAIPEPNAATRWRDYYAHTNYDEAAMGAKETAVRQAIAEIRPKVVWDLGANDGRFSRIATDAGAYAVAFDYDIGAVSAAVARGDAGVLPLAMDLANPSPSLGWGSEERESLAARANADVVLALAVVHHLVIGAGIPMDHVAEYLAKLAPNLLIEWVPESDSQVVKMRAGKLDGGVEYSESAFRAAFGRRFENAAEISLGESGRSLWLLKRK